MHGWTNRTRVHVDPYKYAFVHLTWHFKAGDDAAATTLARHHETGAWVIVLRIFPAAILRDYGGGGKSDNRTVRQMRSALKLWDKGDYVTAYLRPTARLQRDMLSAFPPSQPLEYHHHPLLHASTRPKGRAAGRIGLRSGHWRRRVFHIRNPWISIGQDCTWVVRGITGADQG